MSMNVSSDRNRTIAAGAVCSIPGMCGYFLPVTKGRFIRTAYNIEKANAEDLIDRFNDAAISVSSNRLKPGQKLFLAQEGIAEDFDAINTKVNNLKRIITDNDFIKNMKADLAVKFTDCNKSEALMDGLTSKAFKQVKWTNFAWGVGIFFVIGAFLSSVIGGKK